jgi:hypothetical protein
MLDTKLGASFTVALVFIVSCIFAFVADPINNYIKTSGLEPGLDRLLNQASDYSQLTIDVQTFAPQTPSASCGAIKGDAPGDGLVCTTTDENTESFKDLGIKCSFTYECQVQSSIRGMNGFLLELPESAQYIEWKVVSSFWSPDINTSHFGSVLTTNSSMNEQPLAGTLKEPTTLSFGTIRSSHEDEFKKVTKNALQLFWRGTKKKTGTVSSTAAGSYKHYIAFQFQVEENVYLSKLLRKLNFSSMFSVLIAYTLTALSVLGTGKMFAQKGIDALLRRRAEKEKAEIPLDVLRRERILDEHLLTKDGSRRLSMSVHSGDGGSKKPKKQRRLSSRELMKQEKKNAGDGVGEARTSIAIEMVRLGFKDGQHGGGGGMDYADNPMMKRGGGRSASGGGGVGRRRRHSSTSLDDFKTPLKAIFDGTVDRGKEMNLIQQQAREIAQLKQKSVEQTKKMEHQTKKMEQMEQQIKNLLAAMSNNGIVVDGTSEEKLANDIVYYQDERTGYEYYIDEEGETHWK